VLIRALEPTVGVELMQQRRSERQKAGAASLSAKELCNGPSKLVISMGITIPDHNGSSLLDGALHIAARPTDFSVEMVTTTRIGITQGADLPYRYYVKGNRFVSRP
jgi:DNA-3-methyladenine glycosylase